MKLLTQAQASETLGYSKSSNLLAKMRIAKDKSKWEFTPRFITFNGVIRYPDEWLQEDLKKFLETKRD